MAKEQNYYYLSEENYYSMTNYMRNYYKDSNYDSNYYLSYDEYCKLVPNYKEVGYSEEQYYQYMSLAKDNYNYEKYYYSVLDEVYYGAKYATTKEYSATHGLLNAFTNYLSKFNEKITEVENFYSNVSEEFEKEKQYVKSAITPYYVCPNYY
jgi:hypothetical protein